MEHSSPDMTVEQICTVIDLLNPCIDDHLYVYDFTDSIYTIRIVETQADSAFYPERTI